MVACAASTTGGGITTGGTMTFAVRGGEIVVVGTVVVGTVVIGIGDGDGTEDGTLFPLCGLVALSFGEVVCAALDIAPNLPTRASL